MSIRRRAILRGSRRARNMRLPAEAVLGADRAMQDGRNMVGDVLRQASGAVRGEIQRAQAVFADAQKALASNSEVVSDAMAACRSAAKAAEGNTAAASQRGQEAAKSAMTAMMERLNRITASFGAGAEGNSPK